MTVSFIDGDVMGDHSRDNLELYFKRCFNFTNSLRYVLCVLVTNYMEDFFFLNELQIHTVVLWEPSWPWSYGSWINNYLCNQCLSPLMFRVRISIRARCTTLCDKVCQCLATGRWFSLGPPISSTNITEMLLKGGVKYPHTNKQQTYSCEMSIFNC